MDYYILSIFHNLGSPLSYHTLIFYLMSSRNMYLYNAYIYTYILFYNVLHMIVLFLPGTVIKTNWLSTYTMMIDNKRFFNYRNGLISYIIVVYGIFSLFNFINCISHCDQVHQHVYIHLETHRQTNGQGI